MFLLIGLFVCQWNVRISTGVKHLDVTGQLHSKGQTPLHGHRLRTPPTDTTNGRQFYNLLYNKFTTNGQKFTTSKYLDMSRCWALALRCGKFVVGLLSVRPLVVLYNMSLVGVRVVEFGPNTAVCRCY